MVENGLGAVDELVHDPDGTPRIHDPYRIDCLREHIRAMGEATDDGVTVLGYTTWGRIDLESCSFADMTKCYGFVYVDQDDYGVGTFDRYRKDSFF